MGLEPWKQGGFFCNLLRPLIKNIVFIGSLWLYSIKKRILKEMTVLLLELECPASAKSLNSERYPGI